MYNQTEPLCGCLVREGMTHFSNQLLQGTKVSYGGTATFSAGVGEKARADARIILEAVRSSVYQQRTKESNYVVWQKQENDLVAQASISFVNNKGDVGKTLKELGSSQTVKAAIAAALTAGVLEQLGTVNGMSDIKNKLSNGTAGFSEKLTYNLINATGRALTNTAINGGNLEDALKQALVGGLVDTAHGQAASQIKVLEGQYLAHKLAHALAGCVAGAAAGGKCKDGAIGAAVGEIVAQLMPPKNGIVYSDSEKHNVLALSKLVAGAASAYAGGNAQTAITTAETAVQNNALVPILIGLAWLADKAWTAYDVSQDVAAIRDGTKTVEQVALEKGAEYVTAVIVGNIGRYGVKAVKTAGGKWVQSRVSAVQTTKALHQQQAKNAELLALFDKNNPSTSVTLGKTSYNALPPPDSNISGTTKTFNTASLSDTALQKEVMDYAQQLAGGKAVTPHPTAQGVWNVKLDDGTTINVRSKSSSEVGRWTIEVKNEAIYRPLVNKNKVEVKFK
jgi:hypothetical protein